MGSTSRKRKGSTSSSKKMFKKKRNNLSGIDDSNAKKMFDELCDKEDPTVIPLEGICTLGEKLGIDALDDIRILVLLWKMGCSEKPGQMNHNEWMQGCSRLQVDSWKQMKDLLPTLETGFLEQVEFKEFYKFCFSFAMNTIWYLNCTRYSPYFRRQSKIET